jgi:hypothetical protein
LTVRSRSNLIMRFYRLSSIKNQLAIISQGQVKLGFKDTI